MIGNAFAMTVSAQTHECPDCPDCEDPLVFAFIDTSGVGAHKRGDHFNTTPDTVHYLCFSCAKAWKQRLTGRLTPDVVGDLAFFTCRHQGCGRSMTVTHEAATVTEIQLGCTAGHTFAVRAASDGSLSLEQNAV
jgi:hypothetical protein